MRLIDTHCHLTHPRLRNDIPGVIDRARPAGVASMILAAGNIDEAKASAAAAAEYEGLYCLAGVHPHDAKDAGEGYCATWKHWPRIPRTSA